MSTMNTFYARLVNTLEVYDPYHQGLAKLANVDRSQIETITIGWESWTVDSA